MVCELRLAGYNAEVALLQAEASFQQAHMQVYDTLHATAVSPIQSDLGWIGEGRGRPGGDVHIT